MSICTLYEAARHLYHPQKILPCLLRRLQL